MVMAAGPPVSQGRTRLGLALVAALVVSLVFGVASASANAGKVLVFTGTAGTANPATATAATALQAAGSRRRLHRRRHVRRHADRGREPRRLPRRGVRQLGRQRAQR